MSPVSELDPELAARRQARRIPRPEDEYRSAAERDRDRVLYSSAFRRLAQVTQVVGASETQVFHNRLTHSLKVAQIARRLAEWVAKEYPEGAIAAGGVDPTVAETAGLAHDLGHPPFGHIAEEALQSALGGGVEPHMPPLAADRSLPDSFEGNAQSFRIVTKLSWRTPRPDEEAMNLSRATLAAILKYPWLRGAQPEGASANKWGAYKTEEIDFEFALDNDLQAAPCLEAQIMDWADDIAYAVHDVEDFYRVGLIPLERLRASESELTGFVTYASGKLGRKQGKAYDPDRAATAFSGLRGLLPIDAHRGSRADIESLHNLASELITRYFEAFRVLDNGSVYIEPTAKHEVGMLKELTWYYVIDNPALATLQEGQQRIVSALYEHLDDWVMRAEVDGRERRRLPVRLNEFVRAIQTDPHALQAYDEDVDLLRRRAVVDYVSWLTEDQAVELWGRLEGRSRASALEGWLRA